MAKAPLTPVVGSPQFLTQSEEIRTHLATIGLVASSWAGFELAIDMSALAVANISQQVGLCLTAQISGSARKLDAYIAIARQRGADKNFLQELNTLAKETTALAERRNRAVHDPWFFLGKRPRDG
jgi:hypothetical protein